MPSQSSVCYIVIASAVVLGSYNIKELSISADMSYTTRRA